MGVEFSGDLGCPGVAPDDEPCNSSETLLHVGSGFGKQEVVPGGLPKVTPLSAFVPKNLAEMAVS